MSKLIEFTNFLKDKGYAVEDLKQFQEIIEPAAHPVNTGSIIGYRIRMKPAEPILQKCKVLIQYAWHCRDYVKKILVEHNVQGDSGTIVNQHIKAEPAIQIISYLANAYKHAGVDASQKWATSIAPRYGKPFVRGVLKSFPGRLKPFIELQGDVIPSVDFAGYAIDGSGARYRFEDFAWTFSCYIENKDGKVVGDAAAMCEKAFQTWISVLSKHGINV